MTNRQAIAALRTLLLLAIAQCAAATETRAQEAASCDGTWRYTHIDKARGWPADVEVTISGDKGTYVAHLGRHKQKNSPCRDRDLPVIVKRCTADELVFTLQGDSVIDGCPSFTARFKRTGLDTAEGTIGRGEVVTTRRER